MQKTLYNFSMENGTYPPTPSYPLAMLRAPMPTRAYRPTVTMQNIAQHSKRCWMLYYNYINLRRKQDNRAPKIVWNLLYSYLLAVCAKLRMFMVLSCNCTEYFTDIHQMAALVSAVSCWSLLCICDAITRFYK